MNDANAKELANKLKVSSTTISRVIRHCGGVDSETRERILLESRHINYIPTSNCPIYTILPDIPQYFWSNLGDSLNIGTEKDVAPIRHNIYTKLRDEMSVLEYLNDAERLGAHAIIIAAPYTPAIRQKLDQMVSGRLILFLSEYQRIPNCFYVGADSYADGYSLGEQYASHYTNRKLVMFSVGKGMNVRKREEGFRQALIDRNPTLLREAQLIELDSALFKNFKLLPSKTAGLLAKVAKTREPLCLYFSSGIPDLSLALAKAKLPEHSICLCHDYYKGNFETTQVISCNQDVQSQGRIAVKLATDFVKNHLYPEQKEIYVPSVLQKM